jgi:molybdate transport repressor ModE-like protein
MSRISPERILLLVNVAHCGSMTLAAASLGQSVSAISQQIRKLEVETGHPLIERHSRGVVLTDAGRTVVEHAEQIQGRLKSLENALDDIAGLRAGSLRIGTFPTAGSSLMPLAINSFRLAHPKVSLSVSSTRLSSLLEMLNNREVTMSVLWEYPWSTLHNADLHLMHLMDDPTELVLSLSHPLAGRDNVSMTELLNELWVVRDDDHPMLEVLRRAANMGGFRPNVTYVANDYQEAQAMVAVGVGVALVPRMALTVLRDDVRVVPVLGTSTQRRILLGRLKNSTASSAEVSMADMLVDAARFLSVG